MIRSRATSGTLSSLRHGVRVLRTLLAWRLDELIPTAHRPRWLLSGLRLIVGKRVAALDLPIGQRLRLALEELGPIFVKFGQILSTRRDLLPAEIADALSQLQDRVAPFDGAVARAQVEAALGGPVSQFYAEFDEKPLASASIAQVHPARLHDGREVVVKVLRPNVRQQIDRDLALLHWLATVANRRLPQAEHIRPLLLVAEVERSLIDELDLLREGANGSLLHRNFKQSADLKVPWMLFSHTREDVLTMERVYGIALNDMEGLRRIGVNFEKLAEKAVRLFYTMVFRDNFFHADLHPGNLLVALEKVDDPVFIALDFGIMGQLSPADQRYLAENFLAMFRQDYRRIAELHLEAGWMPAHIRVDELEGAVRTVCEPYFTRPLSEVSLAEVMLKLFQLAQRYELIVQPQLILLQKTLLNIEGLSRTLWPKLDLWAVAHPVLADIVAERYSLRRTLQEIATRLPSWLQNAPEFPRLVFEVLKQSAAGQQRLQLDSADLKRLVQVSRSAQRQTVLAILGAGLMVCAALLYAFVPNRLVLWGLPGWPLVAGLAAAWAFIAAWPRPKP
jgi:ubiquinone biosynthesis protein